MRKLSSLLAASAAILALTACGNSDTTEVNENSDGTITLSAKGVDYKLIQVEAGTFKIGATSEMKDITPFEEEPMHEVTLTKNYYLGETEVTQELWDAVMGTTTGDEKSKKLPMVDISWEDCQQFIKKLNEMSGKQFRLPTEAEWEYAARGGKKTKSLQHSGSIYVERVAWYRSNSDGNRHTVGTMDINELGFHDLCGNVWEWCQDGHVKYPAEPQTDPCAPADSTQTYVIRGGGWNSGPTDCRYTSRSGYGAKSTNADLGFRLAM